MNPAKRLLKSNIFYLLTISLAFSILVYNYRNFLFQKFDPEVVKNYLRSQDIYDPEGKIKDRIFVSDADIYIASGYLYANGAKPTDYNFQHPPFIKYLFGLSVKLFNMPLLPNIVFGMMLLLEVYFLGILVFKSLPQEAGKIIGLVSSLLLLIDPVFKEVTIYALLDLGQMVFLLGYLITALFYPKKWFAQGLLLGLAAASKFYSPVAIFVGLIYLYKLTIKHLPAQAGLTISHELKVLAIAALTFVLCYLPAMPFNLLLHQAKIIRFMLDHNTAGEWGNVLSMFFGGWFLWPVSFFVTIFMLLRSRVRDVSILIHILPTIYFILLTFQLPFTRYFILILPFFYLGLSAFLKRYLFNKLI